MENNYRDTMENLFDFKYSMPKEMTKRQEDILRAAIKVFSEKGFEGSRTSEIAKEAGVAEGTIFRYYKSKKDLLINLSTLLIINFFRPLMSESIENIIEQEKQKSVKEVLENMIDERLKLVDENLQLIKTICVESIYHEELLKEMQDYVIPNISAFLNEFVEKNIENNIFKEKDPKIITRTLISLLLGYVVLSNFSPQYFANEDKSKDPTEIADLFLNGILCNDKKEN
ncbi:TetR/AcrR family transcriptional regulator [Clostridium fermenticellae]|uniref:TetR/AcrR family transcriptional regulator n=1 Tax=Clostridium fermenticellae TaxID=2068654 RepID=A0A386H214_9CLOT|nr:TetR/AcrR family transcriptional regulator [Clostridium fermenticellae]AYD39732.1 TetR/AcrR family transcriptional regulator [Clostridium fermenticellae]